MKWLRGGGFRFAAPACLLAASAAVSLRGGEAAAPDGLRVVLLDREGGDPAEPDNLRLRVELPPGYEHVAPSLRARHFRVQVYPEGLSAADGDDERYRADSLFLWPAGNGVYLDIRRPPIQAAPGPHRVAVSLAPGGETALRGLAPERLRYEAGAIDVALVIDVSKSMNGSDPRGRRYAAARAFTRVAAEGSRIGRAGVVRFNHRAEIALPPTPASDSAAFERALSPGTNSGQTNLDHALETALALLNGDASAPPGSGRRTGAIVLLTDGKNEGARYRDTHRIAAEREIPIYTVGLGRLADRELLRRMALETGGMAFDADTDRDLLGIYQWLAASIGKQPLLAREPVGPGGLDMVLPVDETVRRLLAFADGSAKARATAPSGAGYAAAGARREVDARAPEPGAWRLAVDPGDAKTLIACARTGLFVEMFPPWLEGRRLRLGATLAQDGVGVAGARVWIPAGEGRPAVELFDDGLHGDGEADDGVYGAALEMPGDECGDATLVVRAAGRTAAGWPFVRVTPGVKVFIPTPARKPQTAAAAPEPAAEPAATPEPAAEPAPPPPAAATRPRLAARPSRLELGSTNPGETVGIAGQLRYWTAVPTPIRFRVDEVDEEAAARFSTQTSTDIAAGRGESDWTLFYAAPADAPPGSMPFVLVISLDAAEVRLPGLVTIQEPPEPEPASESEPAPEPSLSESSAPAESPSSASIFPFPSFPPDAGPTPAAEPASAPFLFEAAMSPALSSSNPPPMIAPPEPLARPAPMPAAPPPSEMPEAKSIVEPVPCPAPEPEPEAAPGTGPVSAPLESLPPPPPADLENTAPPASMAAISTDGEGDGGEGGAARRVWLGWLPYALGCLLLAAVAAGLLVWLARRFWRRRGVRYALASLAVNMALLFLFVLALGGRDMAAWVREPRLTARIVAMKADWGFALNDAERELLRRGESAGGVLAAASTSEAVRLDADADAGALAPPTRSDPAGAAMAAAPLSAPGAPGAFEARVERPARTADILARWPDARPGRRPAPAWPEREDGLPATAEETPLPRAAPMESTPASMESQTASWRDAAPPRNADAPPVRAGLAPVDVPPISFSMPLQGPPAAEPACAGNYADSRALPAAPAGKPAMRSPPVSPPRRERPATVDAGMAAESAAARASPPRREATPARWTEGEEARFAEKPEADGAPRSPANANPEAPSARALSLAASAPALPAAASARRPDLRLDFPAAAGESLPPDRPRAAAASMPVFRAPERGEPAMNAAAPREFPAPASGLPLAGASAWAAEMDASVADAPIAAEGVIVDAFRAAAAAQPIAPLPAAAAGSDIAAAAAERYAPGFEEPRPTRLAPPAAPRRAAAAGAAPAPTSPASLEKAEGAGIPARPAAAIASAAWSEEGASGAASGAGGVSGAPMRRGMDQAADAALPSPAAATGAGPLASFPAVSENSPSLIDSRPAAPPPYGMAERIPSVSRDGTPSVLAADAAGGLSRAVPARPAQGGLASAWGGGTPAAEANFRPGAMETPEPVRGSGNTGVGPLPRLPDMGAPAGAGSVDLARGGYGKDVSGGEGRNSLAARAVDAGASWDGKARGEAAPFGEAPLALRDDASGQPGRPAVARTPGGLAAWGDDRAAGAGGAPAAWAGEGDWRRAEGAARSADAHGQTAPGDLRADAALLRALPAASAAGAGELRRGASAGSDAGRGRAASAVDGIEAGLVVAEWNADAGAAAAGAMRRRREEVAARLDGRLRVDWRTVSEAAAPETLRNADLLAVSAGPGGRLPDGCVAAAADFARAGGLVWLDGAGAGDAARVAERAGGRWSAPGGVWARASVSGLSMLWVDARLAGAWAEGGAEASEAARLRLLLMLLDHLGAPGELTASR